MDEDEKLAVIDKKLGSVVQEKLGLNVLWRWAETPPAGVVA